MTEVANLHIEISSVDGIVVLGLHGELDLESASEVSDAVATVLQRRPLGLALDLRGLSFMDSSGIHVVIRAEEQCRGDGIRFCLVGGRPSIRRLLDLCGLDQRFECIDDLGDLDSEPPSIAAAA